ncbi:uncharacterized protein N7498_009028 [Penicillium cinerascens]|uniref:Ketoreductase (KR) domain-containing protein n=1 Tax=Penicillium cinerascens TaxID=70096 RepID=A0A9W9JEV0_9EURO|nr:uncharacterized protein N7498_009028 [Penicillium cinerascens]KAJ5195590.1 hypothetical protein N7498_009028 [Penicillium cinerascens]
MVSLQAVQAHNATLKSLTPGLIAVFGKFNLLQHATRYDEAIAARSPLKALHLTNPLPVGGTSGIALSTALALARQTPSPKIYLIGRSQSAADVAIASMKTINSSAQPTFLQTDISLLKNVDSVCAEIAARERKK